MSRHRLAKLPDAGDGGILQIAGIDGQIGDSGGRAGEGTGLGLPLAEVGPIRVAR